MVKVLRELPIEKNAHTASFRRTDRRRRGRGAIPELDLGIEGGGQVLAIWPYPHTRTWAGTRVRVRALARSLAVLSYVDSELLRLFWHRPKLVWPVPLACADGDLANWRLPVRSHPSRRPDAGIEGGQAEFAFGMRSPRAVPSVLCSLLALLSTLRSPCKRLHPRALLALFVERFAVHRARVLLCFALHLASCNLLRCWRYSAGLLPALLTTLMSVVVVVCPR